MRRSRFSGRITTGSSARDNVDYNLAYIGSDFSVPRTGEFDKVYMNALFDYGYQKARHGYSWLKVPPTLSQMPP